MERMEYSAATAMKNIKGYGFELCRYCSNHQWWVLHVSTVIHWLHWDNHGNWARMTCFPTVEPRARHLSMIQWCYWKHDQNALPSESAYSRSQELSLQSQINLRICRFLISAQYITTIQHCGSVSWSPSRNFREKAKEHPSMMQVMPRFHA